MALINKTQEEYFLGPDGIWDSNDENYGSYQFVGISDIINNFMTVYVGEEKIITKVKRTDVPFTLNKLFKSLVLTLCHRKNLWKSSALQAYT